MKLKIFQLMVVFQIIIIVILLLGIKGKIGTFLISKINSNYIQKNSTSKLKYFYEPKANTEEVVNDDWLPYAPKYTINSDSLNERYEYDLEKKDGVFRIITLGDSFTFGKYVSTERNWSELLEDALSKNKLCNNFNKYEVINLGVSGYDTQYEVERYRIRGQKYNPDLVIWLFIDFMRITEKIEQVQLSKSSNFLEKISKSDLELMEISMRKWKNTRSKILEEVGYKEMIDFQKSQITLLDKYYTGNLLYVSMPNKNNSLLQQRLSERLNSYFLQTTIKWGQPGLYLPDKHYNDNGHKIIMEEIMGYIIENKEKFCEYNSR